MDRADEELILAYQDGDPEAFDELVRRYTPRLYSFILRLIGNTDAADDLTQETFLKAWSGIESRRFTGGRAFQPWVFTIARNTATDYLRKRKAIPFSAAYPEDDGARIADDTDSIEIELLKSEDAERVTEALQKLSPHAREILLLRYQAGMSFEEAADVLGLSINTVKSRGRRALLELKPHLLHPRGGADRIH